MSTLVRPDILIQRREIGPIAIVEVWNPLNLTRDEAVEYHDTLLDHGYGMHPPYFLILSQDLGFLWKESGGAASPQPLVEFPMHSVVPRYLPHLAPTERLHGDTLASILTYWFTDLADGRYDVEQEPERTLARTGFLRDIVGSMPVEKWEWDR